MNKKYIAILSEAKNKVLAESKVLILLYLYLFLFPLGQLLRIPPQSTQLSLVHFYLTDVIVGLVGVMWVMRRIREKRGVSTSLTKPILIFFGLGLFSLLVNYSSLTTKQFGISFLYLFRWIVYAGLYFVVRDIGKVSGKIRVISGLIAAGVVCGILGLVQYIFLPDTRFLAQFGWDPHYYRLIGTFLDPGFLGIILVLTLILLTEKSWQDKKKILIIVWIITYVALALTYSRASYLGFLGGLGMLGLIKKKPRFIFKIVGLLFITLLILPRPGGEGVRLERDSTIRYRIINWEHALTISRDHLLLGVGFNSYRYAQGKYGFIEERISEDSAHSAAGVDSSLLFVLATTGVLGLLGYLGILRVAWREGDIIIRSSLIALLIHSCFTNTLFYPWIMGWWWILLGINEKSRGAKLDHL